MNNIQEYFEALYGPEPPGWLVLWTKLKSQTATYAYPGKRIEEAVETASILAPSCDVYHGVSLLRAKPAGKSRGKTEDALFVPGLWVDLDIHGPAHKATHLPPDRTAALTLLHSFPLGPSLIVHSGYGLQAWWLFERPCPVSPNGNLSYSSSPVHQLVLAGLCERLQNWFRQPGVNPEGWIIDPTADLARVLRVPFTQNHKLDVPAATGIISATLTRYSPQALYQHLPDPLSPTEQKVSPRPEKAPRSAPDPQGRPEPWVRSRSYLLAVPAAGEGERNNTLFRVARRLLNDFALDSPDARELAWEWSQRCRPPLAPEEFERTFQSAARYTGGRALPKGSLLGRDSVSWSAKEAPMPTGGNTQIVEAEGHLGDLRDLGDLNIVYPPDITCQEEEEEEGPNGPYGPSEDPPLVDERPSYDYPRTELGNAELLRDHHGADIRYCHAKKRWLIWTGKVWTEDIGNGRIGHRMNQTIRHRLQGTTDIANVEHRKAEQAWVNRSESANVRRGSIDQATTLPELAVRPEELDADPWLLATANGTLDLRTGELGPHLRQDLITRMLDLDYRPDAKCPIWEAFLLSSMADRPHLVDYLRRVTGYIFTGSVREHALFLFYGRGRNGKGTFVETIAYLLGELAQKAQMESFLLRRGEKGVSNDIARMKGARLVHATEANQGRRLDEATIKELTGGDTLCARFLHQEFFEFAPTHKLVFSVNDRPVITGDDHGIWSRVHLVPWDVRFEGDKQDKGLKDRLRTRAELEGILAWAVRGCLEWQAGGLQAPEEVIAAVSAYREEMDTFGQFAEDCLVFDANTCAKASEIFAAYEIWAREAGERLNNQRWLGQKLAKMGLERKKSGGTFGWVGVGIRTERVAPPRKREEDDKETYGLPLGEFEGIL